MDQNLDSGGFGSVDDLASPFRECLSWQAHKGPILALIMSSYGNFIYISIVFSNFFADFWCSPVLFIRFRNGV